MMPAQAFRIVLPPDVLERLRVRAARAGLFTPSGEPAVHTLHVKAFCAISDPDEPDPTVSFEALASDDRDPDMQVYTRAIMKAACEQGGAPWGPHLHERLDLSPGLAARLALRAERTGHVYGGRPNLAIMASCELAVRTGGQLLNAPGADDPELDTFIEAHPEPDMRVLFTALEGARAASRPS